MTPHGNHPDDPNAAWPSFAAFFGHRRDEERVFLIELNHDAGSRREWSVGSWRRRVEVTADWLAAAGLSPGDSVAALLGNTADALALAYACWVFGACYVPLNPADSTTRQAYILRDAAARMLVHSTDAKERVEPLRETGVPLIEATTLPTLDPIAAGRAETRSPRWDDPATLDLPALRVYTSGTTGDAKGVVLTAANLLADCGALAAGLAWDAEARIMTVLPIHHVNGLIISSLLPWYRSLSTVLCDRFRSDDFWRDVAAEGATVCSMVPTLLEFLLASSGAPPDGLREVLCGAGPLLVETVLDFEQRFRIPVRHLYGLSETTAVATLMPRLEDADRRHWHRDFGFPSIGPALPGVEVAILDGDGSTQPAGLRGEIVIRGPILMRGYARASAVALDLTGEGWFRSGDEGFWQDGPSGKPFFFITGRIKELIIRGGANVSPLEIDEVLRSHPAVRYGLAFPFENRLYGEEIAAYVVPEREVAESEILAHCERYLDFARCPKVVIFGNDVPYTATGKAKRLELKSRLAGDLAKYRDIQFRRPRVGR